MENTKQIDNPLESIKIRRTTKLLLDNLKAHPSMSYDAVIFAFVNGATINWNKAPTEEIKEAEV